MKFEIDFYFAATIVLMALTQNGKLFFFGITSAIIHELGHIAIMVFFGEKIKKIRLTFGLIEIVTDFIPSNQIHKNKPAEKLVIIGGSMANLIFSTLCVILFTITKNKNFKILSMQNLYMGMINLLPIKGLDGGDILAKFLKKFFKAKTQKNILNSISSLCIIIITVISINQLYNYHNFSMIFFIIYLVLCLISPKFCS